MARSWRPLVSGWLGSAAFALVLWAFVRFVVPMADELLRPVYYVALLPGLVGTWRWLRPRGRRDRRAEDRRRAPRRRERRVVRREVRQLELQDLAPALPRARHQHDRLERRLLRRDERGDQPALAVA
jgi:hypothetical protein